MLKAVAIEVTAIAKQDGESAAGMWTKAADLGEIKILQLFDSPA